MTVRQTELDRLLIAWSRLQERVGVTWPRLLSRLAAVRQRLTGGGWGGR